MLGFGAAAVAQAAPVYQEGFESGGLGTWYADGTLFDAGIDISTTTVYAGTKSLKVYQDGPGEGSSFPDISAFAAGEFTLSAAGDYLLDFQVNLLGCTACQYAVLLDGNQLTGATATATNGSGWQGISYNLTGLGSGLHALSLGMIVNPLSGSGQFATYFDNLSISPVTGNNVPEPATLALAAAALGLVATARRRKALQG